MWTERSVVLREDDARPGSLSRLAWSVGHTCTNHWDPAPRAGTTLHQILLTTTITTTTALKYRLHQCDSSFPHTHHVLHCKIMCWKSETFSNNLRSNFQNISNHWFILKELQFCNWKGWHWDWQYKQWLYSEKS